MTDLIIESTAYDTLVYRLKGGGFAFIHLEDEGLVGICEGKLGQVQFGCRNCGWNFKKSRSAVLKLMGGTQVDPMPPESDQPLFPVRTLNLG